MSTIERAADRSTRPAIAVVVAAHNEAERVGATLAALETAFPGAPVWLADDGSSDATAETAFESGVRVVSSARVIGKGAAMTRAVRVALHDAPGTTRDPDSQSIYVLCDGDLGDSAVALAALADAVARGDADVAVAAFAERVGGGVGLALAFARWAVHRRCGLRTTAPISGQRALSEQALLDVLPFADGYGMEIGMTIDAVRAGRRVIEIELDLAHRASGRTLAGFLHRGRQVVDFVLVYLSRR
jgi:glycosyltransferase involved in cell wall biosynthesis